MCLLSLKRCSSIGLKPNEIPGGWGRILRQAPHKTAKSTVCAVACLTGTKMWIVRLALRRPYTVAVMSLLILVMGILSLSRMIVDIFPVINIPVVIVVWNYPGLAPEDMERRVVLIAERAYPRP